MTTLEAETLALRALGWLAGENDLFASFLGATGAQVDQLGDAVEDPAFLLAILEFLTATDATVQGFCAATGVDLTAPMAARQALAGRAETHWT